MAQKKQVQLIDKIDIPEGVILNLWDLNERAQISVEIDKPSGEYLVGEVFLMDTAEKREDLAFERSDAHIDTKLLLIPRKKAAAVASTPRRFVIRARSYFEVQPTDQIRRATSKKQLLASATSRTIFKAASRKAPAHSASESSNKPIFSGSVIK